MFYWEKLLFKFPQVRVCRLDVLIFKEIRYFAFYCYGVYQFPNKGIPRYTKGMCSMKMMHNAKMHMGKKISLRHIINWRCVPGG